MIRILLLGICVLLSCQGIASAGTEVSGHYTSKSGSTATVQIAVQAPPPAAFIVLQHLPAGVQLISASPSPSSYRAGSSQAKWLFKHPGPGTSTIHLQLSKPVANALSGEIQYRPANGNSTITTPIR
jgi:hypothetical protein